MTGLALPVTVGVDGSVAARQDARWAAAEAEMLGAALEVVAVGDREVAEAAAAEGLSVARDADDPEWASAFVDVDPGEQERELLSERLAGWGARYRDVELTRVVDDEQPVRALVARSLQASLLVVGTRGKVHAPGRWGSVAGALLHEAQCAVVVVRPAAVAAG